MPPELTEKYRRYWLAEAGIDRIPESLAPSIVSQATNYVKAVAKDAANGRKRLSQAEYNARLAVCNGCSLLTASRTCADMGCGCKVDKKAWWETENCPQSRWPALQRSNSNHPPDPPPAPPLPAYVRQPEPPIPHPIPKHVTRWAIGITTAPRKRPTLNRCVLSTIRAGFDPVVFAEPFTHCELPSNVRIVRRPHTIAPCHFDINANPANAKGKFGAWRNWYQTLKDLLALFPDAEAVGIFQDDCVFTRGVREFLEHDLWPSDRTGTVSLYAPNWPGYEQAGLTGCKKITGRNLMGAVANVFPRHVAEAIVASKGLSIWRGAARGEQLVPHLKKAIDTYIGHAVAALDKQVFYYTPSLAQHVSHYSAVGHGGADGKRRSQRFPGEGGTAWGTFKNHPPWIRFNIPSGNQRFAGKPPLPPSEPVGVVIPACGSPDLTLRCLDHLHAHTAIPQHVVYVDNGSEDGVADEIERHAAAIGLPLECIRNETNLGFTVAVNQGLRLLTGRHVLLLNNDAFVGPGCVETLVRHLEWHPRTAAVGPLAGDRGQQSLKHGSRRKQSGIVGELPPLDDPILAAAFCRRVHVTEERMLTGFCCLKHRDALAEVGLLDEHPGFAGGLGTDDDWCHRARKKGWRLLLCYDAFAAHLHSTTFRRMKLNRRAMQKRAMKRLRGKA